MKKPLFILGAGSIVAAGLVAGGVLAQGSQPYKGQTITVLLEGHPTSEAIKAMLPDFTKATGIVVNAEIVPYNDLTSKALLAFSSKSGRYDVVMDDWVHGVGYASAGYTTPLTQFSTKLKAYYDVKDFVPKYLSTLSFKGKPYGLPVYGESTFLMYNKDLFAQYKIAVPTTFTELRKAAQTIFEKTDGKVAGITLRGEQGIQNVYVWAAFLWGFGGQWLTPDGKSALNSPEAAKALEFYSDLLRNYGPKGVANFGWQENRLLFQQGKAAMTIDATVNGAFNEDPKESSVVGKVGYAPVPLEVRSPKGGSSSLAVHGFYLASDSKNKEAAWLFMSWATAKDQQIASLTTNPNSGVTSLAALNSKPFLDKYGAFKDAMLKAIARGNTGYLPNVPQANDLINNTGVAISKALAATAKPADALHEATDLNNKALGK